MIENENGMGAGFCFSCVAEAIYFCFSCVAEVNDHQLCVNARRSSRRHVHNCLWLHERKVYWPVSYVGSLPISVHPFLVPIVCLVVAATHAADARCRRRPRILPGKSSSAYPPARCGAAEVGMVQTCARKSCYS